MDPVAPQTVDAEQVSPLVAADGSHLRPLCRLDGGSLARFELAPGQVSRAVSHATVEEIWYVTAGSGSLARTSGGATTTTELRPGTCATVPLGTAFQFRADPDGGPLVVVAVTMPPWPLDDAGEARVERGPWEPTATAQVGPVTR